MTARTPAAPPRRGRRAAMALGMLVLGVGLGAGAQFGYSTLGTSWLADREVAHDVAEFRDQVPESPGAAVPLNTDPTAAPAFVAGDGVSALLVVPSWQGGTGVYGETADGVIPVKEGTVKAVLDTGAAGHYPGTAGPGEVGNFSLAGHRRSYGDSFFHLPDLKEGDLVAVETADAWFVYEVTGHQVVLPSQWQVVAEVPGQPGVAATERYITLTTCHSVTRGAWGNDHRWVVHGRFVGWADHDAGVPDVLSQA